MNNPAPHSDRNRSKVLPERDAWKAMFALSLGFFISLLDQTMVAVATPVIQRDLNTSINGVLWVSSAYLLAVAVPLIVTGRLGDIYGQRRLFILGVSLVGVGATLCSLSTTIEFLIAARVVQGLGASMLMPQSMAVINRVFARERRGRALGAWGIVGSIAGLSGPVIGGFLTSSMGWRGIFLIIIPFALLAAFLARAWVPALPTTARKVDYVSALVSLLAMTAIVVAVQQAPATDWAAWTIMVLIAGIVLTAIFIYLQRLAERRGRDALVPLILFRDRNFSAGTFSVLTLGFMAAAMMLPIMLWLQDVKGVSAGMAGIMMVPLSLISIGLRPMAGIMRIITIREGSRSLASLSVWLRSSFRGC